MGLKLKLMARSIPSFPKLILRTNPEGRKVRVYTNSSGEGDQRPQLGVSLQVILANQYEYLLLPSDMFLIDQSIWVSK